ncbi:uncharacterized protein LOC124886702 [Capsicum annuum]|uniref:uncharacterized protein LOC124886702 n=1 Tax=Capsicum annuum TaxID=4072 RepID=UPI001FB0F33D|nr:uncharacterized protein LOC124886702 [Capsicum annuum]
MAKAYRIEDFDYIMSKVGKVNPKVKEYLEEAGYEKWSLCHSPINRGRMMTSNIVECITVALVEARELPILGFLEKFRILFDVWNCKNSEIASYTNTTLGRRFQKILTDNRVKALRMTVKAVGSYLYCVYESGRRYIIDIDHGTCNYGWYQIDEIPCAHAIIILKSKNIDVKEYGRYCLELYIPNTIVKTYELLVVPILDMKDWNFQNLLMTKKFCHPNPKDLRVGRRKEGI